MAQKIILDTDIGDDIDDAYALALVLASPELDLLGVTTVFGNTKARAQQALTILKIAGREDIPVAAGCGAVMSPRTDYEFSAWRRCLEDVKPRQHGSCLPAEDLPALCRLHGVDFLIETIMSGDGDIIPVTIGAMTNLAMAIVKEPRIVAKIPRIVSMAGAFRMNRREWNIRCDPVAAAIVCASGASMTLVGLDVTLKCRFGEGDLKRLYSSDKPVAKNLSKATEAWIGGSGRKLPVLHDPLAVETLLRPDIVKTEGGRAAVELSGSETYAFTVFTPAPREKAGWHNVCTEVKSHEAIALWLDRVLGKPGTASVEPPS